MKFMNKPHLLTPGQYLTRRDIAALLGGNTRAFLPKFQGEIVAGCFDPKMNPRAPAEILVSSKPTSIIAATQFLGLNRSLPVFLRRAPSCWEYIAEFRAVRYSDDGGEVAMRIYEIQPRIYEKFVKAYGPIKGVLFLEEV
jgi:hypothetical protein